MPIPKPSSDDYGAPNDAGILYEDYRLDQARFHEVTDKELEAFQKEEPVPTIAERLEGVAVVIRELLGEPDFINHEELDVGDVQRALGELEEVISSLADEYRQRRLINKSKEDANMET